MFAFPLACRPSSPELQKDHGGLDRMEAIGARIKRRRLERGIGLKEMSELLQVPLSTYKEWEYGRSIQGEPYEKLARCLGITLGELLTGNPPDLRISEIVTELVAIKSRIEKLEKDLLALS
jgi:transcriptional regulator with XRE-family HTH domain